MDVSSAVASLERSSVIGSDGDQVVVGVRLDEQCSVGVRLAPGVDRHWDVRQVLVSVPEGGLTSQDVRELPLGLVLTEARRLATRNVESGERATEDLSTLLADRSGRLGTDDAAIAAVAAVYAHLVAEGDRSPAQTMARRFGGSPGTWTNRVSVARRRGFLSPSSAGTAAGRLQTTAEEQSQR